MRVRMINEPGVTELVNQETCPVQIVLADVGIPSNVPVLAPWAAVVKQSPWHRLGIAHWVLLDDRNVYATSAWFKKPKGLQQSTGGPYDVSLLRAGIARYKEAHRLRNSVEDADRVALEQLERDLAADLEKDFLRPFADLRAYTAMMLVDLGPVKWQAVMDMLLPPLGSSATLAVSTGVKAAVIRNLANLLVDDSPLNSELKGFWQHVHRVASSDQGDSSAWQFGVGETPISATVRRRAALAIADLEGLDWHKTDTELIAGARSWWKQHRDDPVHGVPFAPNQWSFVVALSAESSAESQP